MAVTAVKAGAVDFLEKPLDDEVLLERIHQALAYDANQRQSELNRAQSDARLARLTPREKEVMQLVVAGLSNKQIAAELKISHRTVEIYRARVMNKLETKSLCELIRIAMATEERVPMASAALGVDH